MRIVSYGTSLLIGRGAEVCSNTDLERIYSLREQGRFQAHHQVVVGRRVQAKLGLLLVVDEVFYSGYDNEKAVAAFWRAGRSGGPAIQHYVDGDLVLYSYALTWCS
jgi:hypothetical protein